jgi:hypothetical protein
MKLSISTTGILLLLLRSAAAQEAQEPLPEPLEAVPCTLAQIKDCTDRGYVGCITLELLYCVAQNPDEKCVKSCWATVLKDHIGKAWTYRKAAE